MTQNPAFLAGCELAYDFAEQTGTTVYDLSGNNNNATVVGPTWTRVGPLGGSLQFDGVDDYCDAGAPANLDLPSALSIVAWIKLADYAPLQRIITKWNPSGHQYGLWINDNEIQFGLNTTDNPDAFISTKGANLTANWLYFVAATWNGNDVNIYLDGKLLSTAVITGTIDVTGEKVYLGANVDANAEYLNGLICAVRIFSRALKSVEVLQMYNYVKQSAQVVKVI